MTWPLLRGQVVVADVALDEPKLFVVVSNNRRNAALPSVLAVRLTTTAKPDIPSVVQLGHPESVIGYAVCDDIVELFEDEVRAVRGGLTSTGLAAIGDGVKAALGLT